MKLTFEYNRDEYARAYWTNFVKQPRLDLIVAVLMILVGSWVTVQEEEASLSWLLIGLGALLILMLLACRFLIPYFIYYQHIQNRGEYILDFTEEAIFFKAKNLESKLDWAIYRHVLVGKEHIFLSYSKNHFMAIPRRVFNSEEEFKSFETLLKRKIPSYS